ncbi:aluminum-activated malate transporter 7-like isoform X2 [Salvia miltiorrhiza]|uniref:aluminum-activated malate transporter 7-like isoform X2 n=1 Tax=Salvia miltiorrhiza TaxID=226208 RepID=UPI0025ABA930|nr:aluminum-activated malate transporter 7-like isoform X2 [Salvia miltiorrhiza]
MASKKLNECHQIILSIFYFYYFCWLLRTSMSSTTAANGSKKGDKNEESCLWSFWFEGFASIIKEICNKSDKRRIIHSIKVGVALVLVSLLYLVNSMFKQIGENAMWAIMTVVVMFELYAGATLSKGINRGIGTLVGGGMGCLAAVLAAENEGIAKPTTIATSLFLYGCFDEYFKLGHDKENHDKVGDGSASIQACKIVINSKSNDEALANHAKWEPWHGKFGLYYPWDKYLEIGEHLRELAATIISLKGCLQSPKQPPPLKRQILKEACENFLLSMVWILKEIGESIGKMEKCQTKLSINPKLQSMKLQLSPPRFSSCKIEVVETDENLAISTLNFLLLEVVEKVEILAAKVEELGEIANFRATKMDV